MVLSATGDGIVLTQPSQPTGSDGSTAGLLSAATPGSLVASAVIAGTAVTGTAEVTVAPGTGPSAAKSSATVPDGTAGQPTTVEIRLRDAQGNDVVGQAGAIAVSVAGANPKGSVVTSDQGSGRYTASYTPSKVGTDRVQVQVSGAAVPGAPFTSPVRPGAADAGASRAVVPACVEFNRLPAPVGITAFDAFGNRVTRGGDEFQIRINQTTPVRPADNGDGSYSARLNLLVGVWRIDTHPARQAGQWESVPAHRAAPVLRLPVMPATRADSDSYSRRDACADNPGDIPPRCTTRPPARSSS